MAALTKTVGVFPKERAIVDRERAKGSYALGPYLLSKLLAEIPVGAVFPLMFGTILYPMARLHPSLSRWIFTILHHFLKTSHSISLLWVIFMYSKFLQVSSFCQHGCLPIFCLCDGVQLKSHCYCSSSYFPALNQSVTAPSNGSDQKGENCIPIGRVLFMILGSFKTEPPKSDSEILGWWVL